MPPPSKKSGRLSRLISGLRRSLVVEAGFPTSLADLFVKNRSRLRKKHNPQNTLPPPPQPVSIVPVPEPVAETVAEAAVPEVMEIVDDVPNVQSVIIKRGFSLLIAEMFALVMVTIGGKQLVFRLTVVAFVFVMFDVFGIRVFEMVMPCAEMKGRLVLEDRGGEMERGIVLPIKEAVSRSVSSGSSMTMLTDDSGSLCTESGESVEMKEIGVIEKGSRRKRIWKKLVPKKLRRKRAPKDCIDTIDILSLGSAGDCDVDEGVVRVVETGKKDEGEAVSGEICNVVVLHNDGGVVQTGRRNDYQTRSMSSRKLLLIVVLLFGLAGGRAAGLAVTVAWFMLSTSIDKLWRKSRLRRVC